MTVTTEHNSNGRKAQDLLDRVLTGKPDETKAKVLDLVLRLGISPQDELFMIMIALNHLQVLVEDAPQDWQTLFLDFQQELDEWSRINLETLNSLIRKSEQERILAETSQSLVNALTSYTASSNKLTDALEKSPLLSSRSKLISHIQELSAQLQSIQTTQRQHTDKLNRLHQVLNPKLGVKARLPLWLFLLLAVLAISSFYNYTLLNVINSAVSKGG